MQAERGACGWPRGAVGAKMRRDRSWAVARANANGFQLTMTRHSERKRRLPQAKPGSEIEGKPLESRNLAHEPDGDFSPRLRSGQATRSSSFGYAQDKLLEMT